MAQNQFSDKDNELLQNLVTKYKAYSKPTDTQKLLVSLYELQNKMMMILRSCKPC